ncbi:hypothetical protein P886_0688 [Alteromonadaceae bacterium 2753L.S.0a.02]|nr:hypothetical protein P886_0688 [Alteromonadaceae bacterium 2753L.S.0a.02]
MNKLIRLSIRNVNTVAIAAGLCVASQASFVNAAEQADAETLQRQIIEERERLDALEEQLIQLQSNSGDESKASTGDVTSQKAAALPEENLRQLMAAEGRGGPYLDESFKKSIPLVGSPWRFSFGGYAKTDVIHDFSGTGNKQEFTLSSIPVDNNPQEGSYTHMQVSETRFHFETRNTESKHDNSVFIEFDFFDESNPSSTRLRHAYARYGNLLVGQTWTLLSELRQLPLILDFAAGDSILGGRTQQIRWTIPSKDKKFGWAIALENYNDAAIYNPTNVSGKARSDFPRIATGVTKLWDRFIWSTGGSVTQLRFEGNNTASDKTDLGFTATTAGRVYLTPSKGSWLGFGAGYESGSITDVITFANAGIPNAAIDANGELDLAKAWNAQLGLHAVWTHTLSSNFSYAYTKITDVPEAFEQDWIRAGAALHANLIYKYDDQLSLGVEVMHGERENVSGREGNAQRIQLSTFYYF